MLVCVRATSHERDQYVNVREQFWRAAKMPEGFIAICLWFFYKYELRGVVGFDYLTAVAMKSSIFWDITSCTPLPGICPDGLRAITIAAEDRPCPRRFHDKSADDKSAHDNSAQTKPHCHRSARDKSAHGQFRTRTNTHMYKCAYSQYYQAIHS
jgi:hypothetical protein